MQLASLIDNFNDREKGQERENTVSLFSRLSETESLYRSEERVESGCLAKTGMLPVFQVTNVFAMFTPCFSSPTGIVNYVNTVPHN